MMKSTTLSKLIGIKYAGLAGLVIGAVSQPAAAAIIGFNTLTGANRTPYLGSTEAGFTITPTEGNWFQGQLFGNPVPSIFAVPASNPSPFQIKIVDSTLPFTFASVDLTSLSALGTSYTIQGFLSGALVLNQVVVPNVVNTFQTFASTNPTQLLDNLTITGTPGDGVSSFNIDNINVTEVTTTNVPEPSNGNALAVLGLGGLLIKKLSSKKPSV